MGNSVFAQFLEDFEDETAGSTTFTNNGQIFNIISAGGNTYDIFDSGSSFFGWNGTTVDRKFIDNTGGGNTNNNINLTVATQNNNTFTLKSMYLFIAQGNGLITGVSGNITISGSLGGVQQFTATISSGYNTSYSFQNGFTYIDMATFGGSNNASTTIDRYTITSTGNIRYISLDAMRWQPAASATVNASVTSLNAFTACQGTASASQSFAVSGSTLAGNLSVTAPTGYEVSLSEGSGYASSVSLSPSSGTVASTTIYVRMSSSATGSPSGNITVSSTGATSKTVAVNGTVTSVSISSQPNNVTACAGGNTSFSVTATGATGYQWQVNQGAGFTNVANGSVYSGATSSTLNISGITSAYNGYAYRVVAANGSCIATSNAVTLSVSSINASTSQTNAICSEDATGTATVSISGGTAPYSYSWSPYGGTEATATGLEAGTYTVTITDNNGCSITRDFTITTANDCSISTTWNGSSWSNGVPVCNAYAVQMQGDYNTLMHGEITACSLTIFSGNITVASGDNFIIKGSVINAGGTLTFENNANLIQIDNASNFGSITYNKNSSALYNYDYTIWSSPVSGVQTLKGFSPGTLDERFYVYNTALGAFSNYLSASGVFGASPDTETFTPGKGYLIRMPDGWSEDVPLPYQGSFTGVPNNGNVNIGLSTQGNGYNAVGNPYPSPINIHDFLISNQTQLDNGTLYFWRKRNATSGTAYATVTLAAYVAATAEGGDTSDGQFADGQEDQWVINPGQGFFVKASAGASSLGFTNTMRRAVNNNQFFRVNAEEQYAAENITEMSKMWLNITNDANDFGQAAVVYSDITTLGLDYGYDGRLFNDGVVSIYSLAENTRLSIQARNAFSPSDEVPLGYKATVGGNYTISLDKYTGVFAQGQVIYLRDNVTGSLHNLKESTYSFATEGGTFNDRFEILYMSALNTAMPVANLDSIVVYKKDNVITVNSGSTLMDNIQVYDIQGRLIYESRSINASEAHITNLAAQQQMLLLRITAVNGTKATKKIIY